MDEYVMKKEQLFISNGVTMLYSFYPEGMEELIAYTKDPILKTIGYTTLLNTDNGIGTTIPFGNGSLPEDSIVMFLYQKFVGSYTSHFMQYVMEYELMLEEEKAFHFHTFQEFIVEMGNKNSGGVDKFYLGA